MTVKDLILVLKQFPQELKVEISMEIEGNDCGRYYGPIHAVGLSGRPGMLLIRAADYDLLENM